MKYKNMKYNILFKKWITSHIHMASCFFQESCGNAKLTNLFSKSQLPSESYDNKNIWELWGLRLHIEPLTPPEGKWFSLKHEY
jgi:hypothetical protein